MSVPPSASRPRLAQLWLLLGILAPLGMLTLSVLMLLDLRRDVYDRAETTSENLLRVIERDIARNFEIFDLSLRAIVDNLKAPGVATVSPGLRQLILFDRAATAQDLSHMFVLDERGDMIVEEGVEPPQGGNFADRDYFRVHRARSDLGLYIGRPIVSRVTGERVLPFSRRIDKPDGSFGGIAYGGLKLSYFARLFAHLGLGQEGAINLYLRDGTRIMREPYVEADIGANIAEAPTFTRFLSARRGRFVGTSVRDGVDRHYTFTQVGDLPLILNVALSLREIEAGWRLKAVVIGASVLGLCGLTVALLLLIGRELHGRSVAEAALQRLSRTDALTDLPNRRAFDEAGQRIEAQACREGQSISLLIVDADHFKRYNDRYGHAVGDAVLCALAGALAGSVHRPSDLVARIGGEEFAILLPNTDCVGAGKVAAIVHEAVRAVAVSSAGIEAGEITVSIGVASTRAGSGEATADLYRRADAALYAAKAAGRNRTHCAPMQSTPSEPRGLRLVGQ